MTWNLFQGNINEKLIRETADAMVEGGFRDAGYEYIFIDDLWQGGRDRENNIIPDPEKFPSGRKADLSSASTRMRHSSPAADGRRVWVLRSRTHAPSPRGA